MKVPTRTLFIIAAFALLIGKLWLVGAHSLMATHTPHDDFLFISQAHSLLSGQWLGEYDQLTLIKGPFYPLFIALAYLLNIPLLTAQQLLYALACLSFALAVRPLIKQDWLLLILFAVLLFNPFSYNYPAIGRVLREGVNASLGLLVVSSMLGCAVRLPWSLKRALIWALICGLSLSAFWNTREESIWILPGLLLLAGAALLPSLRGRTRLAIAPAIGILALPFLVLGVTNLSLKTINEKRYTVPATIELLTPEFKSAYGGLLRIKTDQWRRFIPVNQEARSKAYATSPAFRELQPFIDGELGQKWQDAVGETDIPAAFFIWVFRDSVAAAGYYNDGAATLDFYRRMGTELSQACADQRLDCRPPITSLIPTWHKEYNALVLPTYYMVLKRIVQFRDFSAGLDHWRSNGSREIMLLFDTLTREKLLSSKREVLAAYPDYHRRLNAKKTAILDTIGSWYQTAMPPLFSSAFLFFLWLTGSSIRRKELPILTVFAGAALAGTLAVAFILMLVAITSYEEIERAMHSAYPMALLFVFAVFLDLVSRRRGNEDDPAVLFPVDKTG